VQLTSNSVCARRGSGQNGGVNPANGYTLVRLRNGAHTVRSAAHGETMHPGLGPAAEGRALYADQVRLEERWREPDGEVVVWDVGLGAAANVVTVLRAVRERALPGSLRIVSFDHGLEPLSFAFANREALGYLDGYESFVTQILAGRRASFRVGSCAVQWEVCLADFPQRLAEAPTQQWGKPRVILFDPWSPAKNPAMWTAPLFADLYRHLDPAIPCSLATYSRSTMVRVALLLAGFWVGAGVPTGSKEETTLAANRPELIRAPLDGRWLERVRRSGAAEPMWQPVYRQAPLSPGTCDQLLNHPQFRR